MGELPDLEQYGWANLIPHRRVTAGEFRTWRINYVAGSRGVGLGGKLIVAQAWSCDWGEPQFTSPSKPDYLSYLAPPGVRLKLSYGRRSHSHPWDNALHAVVEGRGLKEGEQLILIYGDRSYGSPGSRAQTFAETVHRFMVLVDIDGSGVLKKVPGKLSVKIVGGEVERLVATIPSTLIVGEEGHIHIRTEDAWGNPCIDYRGLLKFTCTDPESILPSEHEFSSKKVGFHRFPGLIFATPGVHNVLVREEEKRLEAESNPVLVTEKSQGLKVFWGDIHGQAEAGCGAGTVDEYFAYEKYVAGVDFGAHQGNDNLITCEAWLKQRRAVEKYNEPDRFITFHGYEWSDDFEKGGHRNIYYLHDEHEIRRCNHKFIVDKTDEHTDVTPVSKLFTILKQKTGRVLMVAHVGGIPSNLNFHDEELERLIEVHSCHGTFEWFLHEALARGYRVGFTAGSDDVMGRPGASHPGFHYARFVRNGLCAVYAKSLTRSEIWEALHARRTYATTGARILLFFTADGHTMGEEYCTDKPVELQARVVGTTDLEEVKVVRGTETVYTHPMPPRRFDGWIRIYWEGSMSKETGLKSFVQWDGELTVENGRILDIEGYAFDTPREGICEVSSTHVSWRSQTSGDRDGIKILLEYTDRTTLSFNSAQLRFMLPLSDLVKAGGRWVREIDSVNRRVVVEYPPSPTVKKISFTLIDKPPSPGTYPYYLKVVQVDGNQAWASPIYITLK